MGEPPELGITATDLSPGDRRSTRFDWAGFRIHRPRRTDDADFAAAYAALWAEFGEKNEVESCDVLARRFAWPRVSDDGLARRYEFVVVRHGQNLAAVADHTAVLDVRRPGRPLVVHVSHILVTPAYRGSGLAGWMRATPLATARRVRAGAGGPPRPVVLAAEMEHAAGPSAGRLVAFEKAGFLKVDPARVPYAQPDFRPPADIDASGGPAPVPLSLVMRRVGREGETTIGGAEVRAVVESIYAVYADGLRPGERLGTGGLPPDDAVIDLVPPTHAATTTPNSGRAS